IGFRSFRSSSSLSRNRHLRVVHCRRLASPGPQTGGCLQHPVAQTAETGIVSTGFDRLVGPPTTAKDQAVDRSAISTDQSKTSAGVARPGRRHREDRARNQRLLAGLTLLSEKNLGVLSYASGARQTEVPEGRNENSPGQSREAGAALGDGPKMPYFFPSGLAPRGARFYFD